MGLRDKSAVALLSSGLDSSVAMMLAQREGWRIVMALTFDYGQRAATREREQASQLAAHFGVSHRVLALPFFSQFARAGALLSGEITLPQPNAAQLADRSFTEESARAVWVPNRNGIFLEIAAAFAEDLGAGGVIVGFNSEEGETFPDNSVPYMNALSRALSYSTANHVRVVSPTAHLTKQEIVKAASEAGFPFPLLWSCYEPGTRMCGRCESCMRLKRALDHNEVPLDAYFDDATLAIPAEI